MTTASLGFFEVTGIDREFMAAEPKDWPLQPSWVQGKKVVDDLRVTNDCAERGVKLITDYIQNPMTKDEEQLQLLLKLVKDHRERLPRLDKKSDILETM